MTLRDSLARILRRLSRTTHTQARRTRRRLLVENMEERRLMAIDLQLMTASDGMTIYGAAAGDWSGASVSRTGDVNGDGFDDMLVGALYANSGAKLETGASYLIYGGPALPRSLDLTNLGSAGVKILGADSSDGSGAAVTAADMNADGFADLIIGSPTADGINNNRPNSGETYVFFGSASLPSLIDLSVPGSASVTIYGAGNGDQSGSALASAGDVNGDGYADLMIGAGGADGANNLKANSGETYLIYGAATLPAAIDLANLQAAQGTIFYGIDAGDSSGYSVAGAGDVNGDGYADMLIGAVYGSGENNSTRTADTGESYLIFGSPTLPAIVDLTNLGNTTLGIAGVKIYGADANELSGVSVSGAGDVNGDGLDDFLIGSFLSDGPTNFTFAVGLTNLIYGANDLPAVLNLSNLGSRGISMYGSNYFDSVGWAVSSAGDVNADGFDDLLIGASYPSDQPNASYTAKGKTFVVYGASQLASQINLSALASSGIEYVGADTGDTSGWSVAGVGDVNGDGFSDFLIGAPTADAANNAKSSAGESYLLYGGRQASGVTVPGTANSDSLTGSAAADIMNGGRSQDTLISAGGADVLFGGQGNDTFDVSDLNFRQINGGNGRDTLRISATNLNLDLTLLANNRLRSIEQIDLRGAGSNTLKLSALELLNLSNESNTLVVYRDSADTIDFGSGWTTGATETIGQDLFQIYTQGAATLKVQINAPVTLTVNNAQVTGTVLTTLTNIGTWRDPEGAEVTLTASIGTVTKNANGTWSWSYTAFERTSNQTVSITAQNSRSSSTIAFSISALVGVSNAKIYYKGSAYSQSGSNIEAAMDTGKVLLKGSSQAQQTSFSNVSGYSRGINGLVFDIPGLVSSSLTNEDFRFKVGQSQTPATWNTAPSPTLISVTAGIGGSPARVRIEWTDNSIQNTWLEITIRAGEKTGLATDCVYYVGHALGEANGLGPTIRVTNADVSFVQSAVSAAVVPVSDSRDLNKDRRITNADVSFVQSRVAATALLTYITIPAVTQ